MAIRMRSRKSCSAFSGYGPTGAFLHHGAASDELDYYKRRSRRSARDVMGRKIEQRELVTRPSTLEKRAPFCAALQSGAVGRSVGAFGSVGIATRRVLSSIEKTYSRWNASVLDVATWMGSFVGSINTKRHTGSLQYFGASSGMRSKTPNILAVPRRLALDYMSIQASRKFTFYYSSYRLELLAPLYRLT
ncbi:hypothetical protein MRX96_057768 [Rhipicephalus microplus]